MFERAKSLLRRSWPLVGSLYLGYLAVQSPPARYVGIVGLAVVTPLLFGWVAGSVFGVGPWATESTEDDQPPVDGEGRAGSESLADGEGPENGRA